MRGSLALAWALAACGSRAELDTPDGGELGGNSSVTSKCNATTVTELFANDSDAATRGDDDVDQIALDDGYVYFHSFYAIRRVPKGGGAVEILATNVGTQWPRPSYFTLDDSGVSFVGRAKDGTSHLERVTKNGAPLVFGPPLPLPLDADVELSLRSGGYYVWGGSGQMMKIALMDQGGVITSPVATLVNGAFHVIDEGTSPAYIAGQEELYLYQDPQLRIIVPILPLWIVGVVDVGDALFATGSETTPPYVEHVWRIDKATNQSTSIVSYVSPEIGLSGIAVDATNVYITDRSITSVMRVAREGGPLTVVATRPSSQSLDVAVDDDCVYWTTLDAELPTASGVSHVYAAPKPK